MSLTVSEPLYPLERSLRCHRVLCRKSTQREFSFGVKLLVFPPGHTSSIRASNSDTDWQITRYEYDTCFDRNAHFNECLS